MDRLKKRYTEQYLKRCCSYRGYSRNIKQAWGSCHQQLEKKTVDQLSNYGDIAVRAHGLKGNKLTGEVAITFPRQGENALQYLLDQLIDNVDESMTTSLW